MDEFNVGNVKASEWIKKWGGWDREHSDGHARSSPVGSFPGGASPCGALDMAGNVWQWCEDTYDETVYERYARGDFSPPAPGKRRSLWGGCWYMTARFCRVAHRGGLAANGSDPATGFRVVLR
jgi:formylglycine-generating enzyme required for sulfatase activity